MKSNMFGLNLKVDLGKCFYRSTWLRYLVTPLGTVRRYNPSDGSNIIIYKNAPFDPYHPKKRYLQ